MRVNLTDTYGYTAFGTQSERTGQIALPYTYLANAFDPTTKLHDFHARHYDASAGRFMSEDPRKGKITGYETFKPQSNPRNPNPWESVKRVDVTGRPHFDKATKQNVPTPHAQGSNIPDGVRPAKPEELPR